VDTLLSKYASSNIAIFAGVRDPSKADALKTLQIEYPTKLFIVPYDASDLDSAKAAAKVIEEKYGYVDVVVGNAGVGGLGKLHEVSLTKVQEFLNVRIFLSPSINSLELFKPLRSTCSASFLSSKPFMPFSRPASPRQNSSQSLLREVV
jgi:NAD(P)-dependent dehydrogenase (short-subunit alcohol dehydrogenase family)